MDIHYFFSEFSPDADLQSKFIRSQERFEDICQIAKETPEFNYSSLGYKKFKDTYFYPSGWLERKAIAIPSSAYSGTVKVIYHLTKAIIISISIQLSNKVPEDRAYIKMQFYYVPRDLQEAVGRLSSIFNDKYGQYHIQESDLHKTAYTCYINNFNNPMTSPSERILNIELANTRKNLHENKTSYWGNSYAINRSIDLSKSYLRLNKLEKAFETVDFDYKYNSNDFDDDMRVLLEAIANAAQGENNDLLERIIKKQSSDFLYSPHSNVPSNIKETFSQSISNGSVIDAEKIFDLIPNDKIAWRMDLAAHLIDAYITQDKLVCVQRVINNIQDEKSRVPLLQKVTTACISKGDFASAIDIVTDCLSTPEQSAPFIKDIIERCLSKNNINHAIQQITLLSGFGKSRRSIISSIIDVCSTDEDLQSVHNVINHYTGGKLQADLKLKLAKAYLFKGDIKNAIKTVPVACVSPDIIDALIINIITTCKTEEDLQSVRDAFSENTTTKVRSIFEVKAAEILISNGLLQEAIKIAASKHLDQDSKSYLYTKIIDACNTDEDLQAIYEATIKNTSSLVQSALRTKIAKIHIARGNLLKAIGIAADGRGGASFGNLFNEIIDVCNTDEDLQAAYEAIDKATNKPHYSFFKGALKVRIAEIHLTKGNLQKAIEIAASNDIDQKAKMDLFNKIIKPPLSQEELLVIYDAVETLSEGNQRSSLKIQIAEIFITQGNLPRALAFASTKNIDTTIKKALFSKIIDAFKTDEALQSIYAVVDIQSGIIRSPLKAKIAEIYITKGNLQRALEIAIEYGMEEDVSAKLIIRIIQEQLDKGNLEEALSTFDTHYLKFDSLIRDETHDKILNYCEPKNIIPQLVDIIITHHFNAISLPLLSILASRLYHMYNRGGSREVLKIMIIKRLYRRKFKNR